LSVQCSGVIVAPELVLYAGHCGDRVERIALPNHEYVVPVKCEVREQFRPGFEHDIGFCVVPGVGSDRLEVGDLAGALVGYGYGAPLDPGVRVRAFAVTFLATTDKGSFSTHVSPSVFCHGDSGGPLFDSRGRIVGIGSAALVGFPCNAVETEPRFAYYTPMSEDNVGWIQQRTGIRLQRANSAEEARQ
jgi:V8-like Glu-specific endopeptidase